jgi:hypothetical protein
MTIQPPFRVGRKLDRCILDKNGLLVAQFISGNEELAAQVCEFLNQKAKPSFARSVAFTAEPAVLVEFEVAIIKAGYKLIPNHLEERRPIDNTIVTFASLGLYGYYAEALGRANWRFCHSEQLVKAIEHATELR